METLQSNPPNMKSGITLLENSTEKGPKVMQQIWFYNFLVVSSDSQFTPAIRRTDYFINIVDFTFTPIFDEGVAIWELWETI